MEKDVYAQIDDRCIDDVFCPNVGEDMKIWSRNAHFPPKSM